MRSMRVMSIRGSVRPLVGSIAACAIALPSFSEERCDEHLARKVLAWDLLEELVLTQDEDTVHQLDVLVDFGGEHHDGETLFRQLGQQAVEIVLRTDVDPAG